MYRGVSSTPLPSPTSDAGREASTAGVGLAETARPQLQACLDFVREEDVLVVPRRDGSGRSTVHLYQIAEHLARKGVHLQVLEKDVNTPTPRPRQAGAPRERRNHHETCEGLESCHRGPGVGARKRGAVPCDGWE